jgi:hypothetical protein
VNIIPRTPGASASDSPTPNPIEIEHALTLLNAEQVAPGTWTASLSIGVTIRIRDPRVAPPALAARLADRERERTELHTRFAAELLGPASEGADDAR